MAPVHSADAAGGEESNPGHRGRPHGRRHGGRSDRSARERRTEVARAHLDRPSGDSRQLGVRHSDADAAVEHRHGGRHGALPSDRCLAVTRGSQVVRSGESLADDGGFERDHRPALRQRLGDLGGNLQQLVQLGRAPARVTASEATMTARSAASIGVAPPTYERQKAAANASPAPVASTSRTGGAWMWRPGTRQPSVPSLTTGTFARSPIGAPRASDSAAVANSSSGLRLARSSAIRPAPYSL